MKIYKLDPMLDDRWDALASTHPKASVFHQKGWLKALVSTYGYRPIVLTTSPPGGRLSDGIVFCEVKSWITGNRLVSLPFADHSEPLLNEDGGDFDLTEWMQTERRQQNWKYIELRPLSWEMNTDRLLAPSESFWFHTLDLTPSLDQIFCGLHKSCIQRRIGRAEHERLSYERGSSERLLNEFYRLVMITRRRHRLLPQPRAWFRNLVACMGPHAEIRLVRKDSTPIAAIFTLRHCNTLVYKFGCSDARFHQFGGMPFLFWKLIQEGRTAGALEIDFGRTDLDNDGLIRFKDRFGTKRRRLTYFRYPDHTREHDVAVSDVSATRRLFSVLPDALSSRAGQVIYRHIG